MTNLSTTPSVAETLSSLQLSPGSAQQFILEYDQGADVPLHISPISAYRPYPGPAVLTICRAHDYNNQPRYYVCLDGARDIDESTVWKQFNRDSHSFQVPNSGRVISSYVLLVPPSTIPQASATQEYSFDGTKPRPIHVLSDSSLAAIMRQIPLLIRVNSYDSPGIECCGLNESLRRLGNAFPTLDKQINVDFAEATAPF